MIRRRALALLGSAAVHLCALVALLALASSLREPPPLFVDLTGGAPAGDERSADAPTRGRETAIAPARQAARVSARVPRASAPSAPSAPRTSATRRGDARSRAFVLRLSRGGDSRPGSPAERR